MRDVRETFVASDGGVISYLDIGEGVPFVWIHGWGGRRRPSARCSKGWVCVDSAACALTKGGAGSHRLLRILGFPGLRKT